MLLLHHGSSLTIEEARQHDLNLPPCYALSLVIPTYNEVKRLPRMLDEALPYFSNRPGLTEMLIVDDGSTDGTAELVHLIAKQYKGPIDIKLVRISTNAGKGNALIQVIPLGLI
jgi:dolichyl-phosphate beta-glucosyltransferase